MTYDLTEVSIESSRPYFLYEFYYNGTYYRYTDYVDEIDQDDETWSPIAITHSSVKQSEDMSKNSLTIEIPIDTDIADIFKGWSPETSLTFSLYRGQFGEDDTIIYWKGRVSSHGFSGKILELECESIFTSMKRYGVRAKYQRLCRHSLFSDCCSCKQGRLCCKWCNICRDLLRVNHICR